MRYLWYEARSEVFPIGRLILGVVVVFAVLLVIRLIGATSLTPFLAFAARGRRARGG